MKLSRQEADRRDQKLMIRVRVGDHDAMRELFYEYYPDLVNFARKQLRLPSDAPDVVQDILGSMWNRRSVIEIRATVQSYFFGAVRLRSRDVRVHQVLVGHWMTDSDAPDYEYGGSAAILVDAEGEEAPAADEAAAVVEKAVAALSDRCQEVYRLSRYHQLSHREISESLGISVNTVNVQLSKALKEVSIALASCAA